MCKQVQHRASTLCQLPGTDSCALQTHLLTKFQHMGMDASDGAAACACAMDACMQAIALTPVPMLLRPLSPR